MTDSPAIVVSTTPHPCGCVVTVYSNGRESTAPCPPCGLVEVGNALQHAGAALISVAQALARGGPATPKPPGGPSSPLRRV